MAISRIEIETSALDQDRSQMEIELQKVKTEIQQLFEEIQQLDAMWEGAAKQAFQIQFHSDCDVMDEICVNLNEYIESMKNASLEYKKSENTVADLISAIQI